MNCYAGLAKRFIKSCFPQVIPVTQLEPLDAKNIVKHRSYQLACEEACEEASKYPCERWKEVYEAHMNVSFKPKPISDEEAWAVTVAWAEAKAKERETKEESQTDTDESYDSDDSEFGVPTYPVKKSGLFANEDEDTVEQLVRSIVARWVITLKKWHTATTIQAYERGRAVRSGGANFFVTTHNEQWRRQSWWVTTHTVTRTALAMSTLWNVEKRAATIIQAIARGMSVRAWKAQFIDGLAIELTHIYRSRYLKRCNMGMDTIEQHLAEQWSASPKYVKAWIKLAEQRRYGRHF
jgi:hypothetical protein